MQNNISTITDRGQVSIPAHIRKKFKMRPGQSIAWEIGNDSEITVKVLGKKHGGGPLVALGYALQFHADAAPSTDSVMKELRAGDKP